MNKASLTLRELLRLNFAESVSWISAKSDSDIPIQWVVLTVEEVGSGDVLLISANKLSPKVVEQTLKRGGSAVVCVGDCSQNGAQFPEGIPIVAVPGGDDFQDIYRTMLTILINQRAHLMERGVRIHAQLSQIAAEGDGLSALARAMHDLSGRGVLVQDKRLGILAEFPSSTLHAIWGDILAQLLEKENLPKELQDRKKAGKKSTINNQTLPGEIERIVTPISVGGVARGYLSLVDMAGMLDSLDYLVAEQGAMVCAVEMARAKAVREAEKRLKGSLLSALLHENIEPRDANLWVESMGLSLDQSHLALRFSWDAPVSAQAPSMRRLETLINGEIKNQNHRVIVETIDVEIVCIFELSPDQGRPDQAIEFAEVVMKRAREEYPDIPMRCGIGNQASDISAWRLSFRQAGQSLAMARKLRRDHPLYYADLSVYRLLMQLEHHPELIAFKNRVLGPLLSQEGSGELIHTLEIYFENNANLSHAAEALFIHRNTLTYRLERVAEICDIDLNNPETRLAAQLALRIHKMTDSE